MTRSQEGRNAMKLSHLLVPVAAVALLSACGGDPSVESDASGASEVGTYFELAYPQAPASQDGTVTALATNMCFYANNVYGPDMNSACNNAWATGKSQCYASGRFNIYSWGTCGGSCNWLGTGCWANVTVCCN
jgi:hypothetical protein